MALSEIERFSGGISSLIWNFGFGSFCMGSVLCGVAYDIVDIAGICFMVVIIFMSIINIIFMVFGITGI